MTTSNCDRCAFLDKLNLDSPVKAIEVTDTIPVNDMPVPPRIDVTLEIGARTRRITGYVVPAGTKVDGYELP